MRDHTVTWSYALPHGQDATRAPELLMDDETFAAFYQRTSQALWAYLARVSGSATLADDLVQETYLRFLSANIFLDGEVARRRYLFRIATNLLCDHWRKPATSAIEDVPEQALAAPESRLAVQVESHFVVDAALAQMTPRDRQLLWLAYAEGASHREIAAITGLRETSIRLLLYRARHRIAKLIRKSATLEGTR